MAHHHNYHRRHRINRWYGMRVYGMSVRPSCHTNMDWHANHCWQRDRDVQHGIESCIFIQTTQMKKPRVSGDDIHKHIRYRRVFRHEHR